MPVLYVFSATDFQALHVGPGARAASVSDSGRELLETASAVSPYNGIELPAYATAAGSESPARSNGAVRIRRGKLVGEFPEIRAAWT